MEPTHCCDSMRSHIEYRCDFHKDIYDCPDSILKFSVKYDEYGIIIHDGGTSSITILFCPFCGQKLPDSKRDLWFETLEAKGLDPWEDETPAQYNIYGWWLADESNTGKKQS